MQFNQIKVIFFDLDNTLFDHSRAETVALKLLLKAHPLKEYQIDPEEFVKRYKYHNDILWDQLTKNQITQKQLKRLRFQKVLQEYGLDHLNFDEISDLYLSLYTQQTFLAPKVKEVLDYLIKSYELGVISNGFATIQRTKIKNLGLESYFKYQIYSSQVGVMKPRPEIFLEAMREAQKAAHEICFVGDSYEYDILGAKRVGWKAILYAPDGQIGTGELADAVINDLGQLKEIF